MNGPLAIVRAQALHVLLAMDMSTQVLFVTKGGVPNKIGGVFHGCGYSPRHFSGKVGAHASNHC